MSKSRDAFRTISEVSDVLDTPAHVLRFWESKFTQVKPVKRAGGRRYYRPADVDLLAGIKKLLHDDGMTIKGAQKLLREQGVKHVSALGSAELDMLDMLDIKADIEIEAEALQEILPEDTPEPKVEAAPEPAPESTPDSTQAPSPETEPKPALKVDITNVVSMSPTKSARPAVPSNLSAKPTPPPPAAQAPTPEAHAETAPVNKEPAPEHTAAQDTMASEPVPEEAAAQDSVLPELEPAPIEAAPTPKIEVPDDPSDSDSKLSARLFHILHKAPHDRLAAKAETIAPLLDRMQVLRDRIDIR